MIRQDGLGIANQIHLVRGCRVMLDSDLAQLYGVATGQLTRAVSRNSERFPSDFMFQLTSAEFEALRCQIGISNARGGRRYLPYVFTEQGVAMLSSVLRGERPVRMNIEIMRTFVALRRALSDHAELASRLDELEQRYDDQFKAVFDALRALIAPPDLKPKRIGFLSRDSGEAGREPAEEE